MGGYLDKDEYLRLLEFLVETLIATSDYSVSFMNEYNKMRKQAGKEEKSFDDLL